MPSFYHDSEAGGTGCAYDSEPPTALSCNSAFGSAVFARGETFEDLAPNHSAARPKDTLPPVLPLPPSGRPGASDVLTAYCAPLGPLTYLAQPPVAPRSDHLGISSMLKEARGSAELDPLGLGFNEAHTSSVGGALLGRVGPPRRPQGERPRSGRPSTANMRSLVKSPPRTGSASRSRYQQPATLYSLPANIGDAPTQLAPPSLARRDVERAIQQLERYEASRRQRRTEREPPQAEVSTAVARLLTKRRPITASPRVKHRGRGKSARRQAAKLLLPRSMDCGGVELPYLPREYKY